MTVARFMNRNTRVVIVRPGESVLIVGKSRFSNRRFRSNLQFRGSQLQVNHGLQVGNQSGRNLGLQTRQGFQGGNNKQNTNHSQNRGGNQSNIRLNNKNINVNSQLNSGFSGNVQ